MFSEVLVSTDDHAIADVAKQYGAHVPWLRPPSWQPTRHNRWMWSCTHWIGTEKHMVCGWIDTASADFVISQV
ncbi:hypothetical protein ACFOKJ_09185 [Vogesella amnigena]|uniref:Uncharacterized protein n=1 Tax=Vogesella amnigena TaxID=1507449 RepID=A0ABV7TU70_9NEIS